MTITPPRRCLISGRDYSWTLSTREGFHSFCYIHKELGDRRVAAIAQAPAGHSGWRLLWGEHDERHRYGDWQPQDYRYILDARDVVDRKLPHYLAAYPEA